MNTKLFKRVILLFILCFCIIGCNRKTDNTKTSNISTLNELTNTETTSAPTSKEITTITSEILETQVNEDEIPHGFDDKSYRLYKSGVLDKFITSKSEVDQCVITGIFCALHEKSICLYFQPKFFGMGPYCEEPKLYIPIENLLSSVKVPFWSNPSKASSHIAWQG